MSSTLYAADISTVADDYVWKERFAERMELAGAGNAEAQYNVGEMYEKGSGVLANLKSAFNWFELAANQNHQKAQYKIAYMYYRGEGVETNPTKAFQLMDPLAKIGYARAQHYLALMYETGVGTTRNLGHAQLWYSRAAAGGYAPAVAALADKKRFSEPRSQIETARAEPTREQSKKISNIKAPASAGAPLTKTPLPNVTLPISKNDSIAAALQSEAARGAQIALGLGDSTSHHNLPLPSFTAVAGIQPAIQMQPTIYSSLAHTNWVSQSNLPVEFLPSKFTACESSNEKNIECVSKELFRVLGDSEIGYKTQATVYAVQPTGEFKISYRNNIVKINRRRDGKDSQKTEDADQGIKLGLQETEHHLECKLENERTIQCVKNKTQKITITRQTAL
jgi:hypothetical protein